MIKHFDAWGNPILGYSEMITYYQGDAQALKVIRSLPPYKYLVIPTVYLIVQRGGPGVVTVRKAWPGCSTSIYKNLNDHSLSALRDLYRSPEATWRRISDDFTITFIHRGTVIPALWSNIYELR